MKRGCKVGKMIKESCAGRISCRLVLTATAILGILFTSSSKIETFDASKAEMSLVTPGLLLASHQS
jgi:hypothetical protein